MKPFTTLLVLAAFSFSGFAQTGVNLPDSVSFCEGSGVVLDANMAGTYIWNTGETFQSITVVQVGSLLQSIGDSWQIDIEHLPAGVYVIELSDDHTRATGRFVKG